MDSVVKKAKQVEKVVEKLNDYIREGDPHIVHGEPCVVIPVRHLQEARSVIVDVYGIQEKLEGLDV